MLSLNLPPEEKKRKKKESHEVPSELWRCKHFSPVRRKETSTPLFISSASLFVLDHRWLSLMAVDCNVFFLFCFFSESQSLKTRWLASLQIYNVSLWFLARSATKKSILKLQLSVEKKVGTFFKNTCSDISRFKSSGGLRLENTYSSKSFKYPKRTIKKKQQHFNVLILSKLISYTTCIKVNSWQKTWTHKRAT